MKAVHITTRPGAKQASDYDLIQDPKMREFLFGEGGPLDPSPPVLKDLKKWTGSPRFHLDAGTEKDAK